MANTVQFLTQLQWMVRGEVADSVSHSGFSCAKPVNISEFGRASSNLILFFSIELVSVSAFEDLNIKAKIAHVSLRKIIPIFLRWSENHLVYINASVIRAVDKSIKRPQNNDVLLCVWHCPQLCRVITAFLHHHSTACCTALPVLEVCAACTASTGTLPPTCRNTWKSKARLDCIYTITECLGIVSLYLPDSQEHRVWPPSPPPSSGYLCAGIYIP